MPKIKYEEEYSFKGVLFKKWEIFYADRDQSEWSWWGYYWRRWGIVIVLLCSGFLPWLILLYLLFWGIRPRNRRLFINADYIWWRGGWRSLFTSRVSTAIIRKDKVAEVKIYKKEGEIQIYKQGVVIKKSYIGRMLNIGKIEEIILLMKKNNYPLTLMEE